MPVPLSVVMVSASFHPYIGGAEKQALELSLALKARGVAVRVLTRARRGLSASDEVRGIPIVRLGAWGSGFVNAVTFMGSLFFYLLRRAPSYQVIHVHLAGSPALPAALAGKLLGKRVFIKIGGGRGIGELAASARTWTGRLKLKLLGLLSPRFVVVTKDLAEELAAFGLGGARLRHLPNGVDAGRYRPAPPEEKAVLRKTLGWPEGLCFLYVGRLSWEKRLPYFLEAWGQAFLKTPGTYVVLIGAGPEQARLKELVSRWPSGRALLLPPTDQVQSAYAAADLFILPSISEGLSNALLEAMSSGLAILASRVGGTAEVVEEGRSGLLFDPENLSELNSRFETVLARPAEVLEMGRAARRAVEENFSMERVARRYEELYREAGA